jgi:hypothetical protein
MNKLFKRTALAVVVLAALIQFIPVRRKNPLVTQDVAAPPQVKRLLAVSCYDCHSNQTNWPLYGFIAPVSWLLAHDVAVGRAAMNFSRWDSYANERKDSYKSEIYQMVENKLMPPPQYLLIHSKARVDSAGLVVLRQWSDSSD